MTDDPWASLGKPDAGGLITGRRIDAELRWDCFWAKDDSGRRAWVMSVAVPLPDADAMPALRGIAMTSAPDLRAGRRFLMLTLKDSEAAEPFHRLCMDLVAAASGGTTEADALHRVVRRTWRWHHLLRGAAAAELSMAEQMGLVAELDMLGRLLAAGKQRHAVRHWSGPVGAAKDFELGTVGLEVKAHRGGAAPEIRVSSEFQLEKGDFASLYLGIYPVSLGTAPDLGKTVSDAVARIRNLVQEWSPADLDLLESRLAAVGYAEEHIYSDRWLIGDPSIFEVQEGFPAIGPAQLPPGVRRVTYAIDLRALSAFETTLASLIEAVGGTSV